MNDKLYTKDSIESLSPLEFTRLRPGVYAGDTTYSTQLLVEIVSNAVDEFRLGHGNKIQVKLDKDVVTVRDYGQGFLVNEKREDGLTVLEAAFSILNTSGKYREDGTYEGTSLGSFGIGSKITTFLSHWLEVTTIRDNKNKRDIVYGYDCTFKDGATFETDTWLKLYGVLEVATDGLSGDEYLTILVAPGDYEVIDAGQSIIGEIN